jgi:chromosome segregation ATPase
MLMMLVILSTAIGTFTGVVATVLLMQRKGQFLASTADLAARQQAPELERSLATAFATVEELRKQAAAQGQILQQNREELERKQQELDMELGRRAAAEQQVGPLTERVRDLTARVEDERRQKEELAGWNVTLTAQAGQQSEAVAEQLRGAEARSAAERQKAAAELDAVKHEKEELAEKVRDLEARAAAERQAVSTDIEAVRGEKETLAVQLRDLEAKAAAERLAVWAELDGVRRENGELAAQLRDLQTRSGAELEAERRLKEEWAQRHAALSAEAGQQAGALAEQLHALEARVAEDRLRFATELDAARQERDALEAEVEQERASAAEGMELLSRAHKKFSGVFEMRFTERHNGNGHHAADGSAAADRLPVPALTLAADDEAVFAFAPAEVQALSEVAGD